MDELRLSLLIIGTCFIVGVLAHGLWKIRKSNKASKRERIEPRQWEEENDADATDDWADEDSNGDAPDYDDLGLGKVRVVASTKPTAPQPEPQVDDVDDFAAEEYTEENVKPQPKPAPVPQEKLYGSVVSNPKPHMQHGRTSHTEGEAEEPIPAPPGFLIRKEQVSPQAREVDSFSLDTQEAAQAQPEPVAEPDIKKSKKKFLGKRRQEPNFGDDQMKIDFDDSVSQSQDATSASSSAAGNDVEQEVLIINVKAADDAPIAGAALLPLLLTLGFKFGDQDIFHRHVNSNGKGPVLFSLANMFKPGVFDIDNLETFSTQGVSLFMILPIEGDAHQVFNMMHNAARKIADEFNGQILDGRRSVLTKQGLQQYMEKIREFERKRMIARH